MDVNVILAKLRAAASLVLDSEDESAYATALAEQVEALDEWLSKGGFLPADWDAKRS